jgi:hypothetical protein
MIRYLAPPRQPGGRLSEKDERNNKKLGALETMITLPAKYVMSAIGAALSISGFVALVTTQSVKTWVKSHPYPIYLALIVAVLAIAGTLDYAYNLRKRIKLPSDHDKKFYGAALERLPVNGTVIGWLKRTEMTEASVADFPADVLSALERTIEYSRTQPVGFDDTRVADSFESLIGAITSFRHSVDSWTFAAHTRQFKGIAAPPPEIPQPGKPLSGTSQPPVPSHVVSGEMQEDTVTLTRNHHNLVSAYDQFIRTAHARGVDIDA